jgi:hypothetical protein
MCRADRGFDGFGHRAQARTTGAPLPWRRVVNRTLPVEQVLPAGSHLGTIGPSGASVARSNARVITVRVIDHTLPKRPDAQAAPAMEVAEPCRAFQ